MKKVFFHCLVMITIVLPSESLATTVPNVASLLKPVTMKTIYNQYCDNVIHVRQMFRRGLDDYKKLLNQVPNALSAKLKNIHTLNQQFESHLIQMKNLAEKFQRLQADSNERLKAISQMKDYRLQYIYLLQRLVANSHDVDRWIDKNTDNNQENNKQRVLFMYLSTKGLCRSR